MYCAGIGWVLREELCATEDNTQDDLVPPCARVCPGEQLQSDRKTIRPPIFTSEGNLLNASSVGLDSDLEVRADY